MFAYIDPDIRQRLENDRWLVNLDRQGQLVPAGDPRESYLSVLGPVPIPRLFGQEEHTLSWYPFVRRLQLAQVLQTASKADKDNLRELLQTFMHVNSVLALPGFATHPNPLVRVHSCCMTGDVFGSRRCECGPQLDTSFQRILDEGGGAVVYMSSHEGRGIGLWAKAITYLLQDEGQDTYQANTSLGLPEDSRDFTDAAVVLRYLRGGGPIRLLSNNLLKREHLEQAGQPVSEMVPLVTGVCHHNKRYLQAKRSKGHLLPEI